MERFLARFKEPSTWRGICFLLTGFGIVISPEMMEHIIVSGTAIVGMIGMFTSDNK